MAAGVARGDSPGIEQYGEPDEVSASQLIWRKPGPWKRIAATKAFYEHRFPAPHIDAVESVIDYRVPPKKFTPLAAFDGSVYRYDGSS